MLGSLFAATVRHRRARRSLPGPALAASLIALSALGLGAAGCGGNNPGTSDVFIGQDIHPPDIGHDFPPVQDMRSSEVPVGPDAPDLPVGPDLAPPDSGLDLTGTDAVDAISSSDIGGTCTSSGGGGAPTQGTCGAGELCLTEQGFGFPGGYCTEDCTTSQTCPNGSTCVDTGQGFSLCLLACDVDVGCRTGYDCQDAGNGFVCVPPNSGGGSPIGTNNGAACVTPEVVAPGPGTRVFGTNTLLSPAGGFDAETFITAKGGKIAVGWIHVDVNSGNALIGVASSADNGAHWTAPSTPFSPVQQQSDPVLTSDTAGNFYITWVGFDIAGQLPSNMKVFVVKSTDGGQNWGTSVVASANDFVNNQTLLDKPWISVTPDGTKLVATYSVSNINTGDTHIHANISTDNGQTFRTTSLVVDGNAQGTTTTRNLAMPLYDAAGNLHVVWVEIDGDQFGDTANRVMYAQLPAGASAFNAPVQVSGSGDSPVFEDPSVAIGASGKVHVGYVTGTNTGAWDIKVATSTNGTSFGAGVQVNDDTTCATHFHHQIVTDSTGRIHVAYYDNRYLTGNFLYTRSTDGGQSFQASQFINDQGFPFTTDRMAMNWLGDYPGLAIDGTNIYAVWSDPRNNSTSEIYFAQGTIQ
jgi:hypothetical protein